MKILIACSTIDLKYKLGCTPSWWQLFKALHETGNEVIVVPYLGDSVDSLWWRTYPNPCSWESKFYNSYLDRKKKQCNLSKHNAKSNTLIIDLPRNMLRIDGKNILWIKIRARYCRNFFLNSRIKEILRGLNK